MTEDLEFKISVNETDYCKQCFTYHSEDIECPLLVKIKKHENKMKGKLEFDLNDPDDRMEHLACIKASEMAQMLWHIRFNLRGKVYAEADNLNDQDKYDPGIELTLNILNELFDQYNINIEELTR